MTPRDLPPDIPTTSAAEVEAERWQDTAPAIPTPPRPDPVTVRGNRIILGGGLELRVASTVSAATVAELHGVALDIAQRIDAHYPLLHAASIASHYLRRPSFAPIREAVTVALESVGIDPDPVVIYMFDTGTAAGRIASTSLAESLQLARQEITRTGRELTIVRIDEDGTRTHHITLQPAEEGDTDDDTTKDDRA